MKYKLVIVESPAKAKTLGRILGKGYIIKASMGHVRDLPENSLGIDINDGFKPLYRIIPQRKNIINEVSDLAKSASAIFLATDPDREGEAISWHLVQAAKLEKLKIALKRVAFHEITREAVEHSFRSPRSIDMKLVDAQQARRILDRLVGYKLSPLLWKKVLKGLSAGRVQSAAVRLIVDREREIQNFKPIEYWSIEAELIQRNKETGSFRAILIGHDIDHKINIPDKPHCEEILNDLKTARYQVDDIRKKAIARQPAAPFITSTLQQEAWRKLHFTAKKTMLIAQQLYEGLNIGEEGETGLITYMRTDSTNIALSAIEEIRNYIKGNFSEQYLPDVPRKFTKKVKLAQEAHEAIRPTRASRIPSEIKKYLNKDQFALYELIWKRTIASQMSAAIYDTITVDVKAENLNDNKKSYLLQTKSSSINFPGFMILYTEGRDEDSDEYDIDSNPIPQLSVNESLKLIDLHPQQFFTQPPARYTEASLIKALEQKGIGRPSTYAPIISTIQERGYVYKDSGKLWPDRIGMIVNDLLVSNFPNIVDYSFTAKMENELDDIAKGKINWLSVIKSFYQPFEKDLSRAQENLDKVVIKSEEKCPLCGREMVIKSSRFGKFLACSNYPECKGKKAINDVPGKSDKDVNEDKSNTDTTTSIDKPCPKCGKPMIIKKGRYGRFYACSDFPACDGTASINGKIRLSPNSALNELSEQTYTKEICAECGSPMVIKNGRFGKFLACSRFPQCRYTKKITKYRRKIKGKKG